MSNAEDYATKFLDVVEHLGLELVLGENLMEERMLLAMRIISSQLSFSASHEKVPEDIVKNYTHAIIPFLNMLGKHGAKYVEEIDRGADSEILSSIRNAYSEMTMTLNYFSPLISPLGSLEHAEQTLRRVEEILARAEEALSTAQSAAGLTGQNELTSFLEKEFKRRGVEADSILKWFHGIALVGLLSIVLLTIVVVCIFSSGVDESLQLYLLTSKAAFSAILVFVVVWYARNYRIVRHQEAIYRQREITMRTLVAYAANVTDPDLQDNLKVEIAKIAFAPVPTGFVGGRESEQKTIETVLDSIKSSDH